MLFGNIPLYGQERSNIEVFHQLKQRGINSLFVTHKDWGFQAIQPELDKMGLKWTVATYAGRLENGVNFFSVVKFLWEIGVGSCELFKIILQYKPTHIHVFNPTYFLDFSPLLLILKTPMVYLIGDEPQKHNWAYRALWKLIIKRVDRFVCISSFIKKSLLNIGTNEKKITDIIFNFPPTFIVSEEDVSRRPLPLADHITVVYMGQITEKKGVPLLVHAAIQLCSQYPKIRFLIVGDIHQDGSLSRKLMTEIENSGFKDKILFLGYAKNIPQLLEMSHIHVCPSVWEEPLSNVVGEAKRAKIPSVIFPSGGLPELITHQVDGFICDKKTTQGLIEGIRFFLDHPEKRMEAGHKAYESLEQLGVNQFADKWERIYKAS